MKRREIEPTMSGKWLELLGAIWPMAAHRGDGFDGGFSPYQIARSSR
jgi:hypothetical protein